MSETRTQGSNAENATDGDKAEMGRQGVLAGPQKPVAPVSSIGIYERPARRTSHRSLNLILLFVIILLLAFFAYQWWF